jgi:hypothetical protein
MGHPPALRFAIGRASAHSLGARPVGCESMSGSPEDKGPASGGLKRSRTVSAVREGPFSKSARRGAPPFSSLPTPDDARYPPEMGPTRRYYWRSQGHNEDIKVAESRKPGGGLGTDGTYPKF